MRDTGIRGFMDPVNRRGMSYEVHEDLWTGEEGQRKLAKTVRNTITDAGTISVTGPR